MALICPNSWKYFLVFLITICSVSQTKVQAKETPHSLLTVSTHDITVIRYENKTFDVLLNESPPQDITVILVEQFENMIRLEPGEFSISALNPANQTINIFGLSPGNLEVTATSQPNETWIVADLFLRITVANSKELIYISLTIGWIYFAAWSISFYPQIINNFQRKSVVGLNFDFLALNVLGHSLYLVFNCGLYWDPTIQAEYESRHPRGLNPVMLNDVIFSMHATFATLINIVQCFIYERGDQRVSKTASGLLGLFVLFLIISVGLAFGSVIHWLDFLYYCSYIKLAITIIKYVPQALMNYRRKSTAGWSIGNILLDFTGGMLSMLQMILNAYNYDDWRSIFGDPTKFGLGLFSVLFDVFFMLQHYVFYSDSNSVRRCPRCLTKGVVAGCCENDCERDALLSRQQSVDQSRKIV